MPARRETLMAEIVTRLDRIDKTAGYNFTLGQDTQRYKHYWGENEQVPNVIANTPAIVVTAPTEQSTVLGSGLWQHSLAITLEYHASGGPDDTVSGEGQLDDDEVIQIIEDVAKALFTDTNGDPDEGLGIGATVDRWTSRIFDPEDGQPEHGVTFEIELTYETDVGDYSARSG